MELWAFLQAGEGRGALVVMVLCLTWFVLENRKKKDISANVDSVKNVYRQKEKVKRCVNQ